MTNEANTVELKSCPFCGGSAEIDLGDDGDGPFAVMCRNNDCLVNPEFLNPDSRADAIAAWNRRVTQEAEGKAKPMTWRCFHCDEVFTDKHSAEIHFGRDMNRTPACKIKGSELGLVEAMRRAENDASEAWHVIHAETTDASKAYYAQNSRHQEQLRVIEQIGYDRGIDDAKAHPETLGLAHEAEGKVDAAKWIGPYSTAADALDGLRRAVAEEIGEDPETWPAHGNAPLAIAATVALLRRPVSPQAVRAGVIEECAQIANNAIYTPTSDCKSIESEADAAYYMAAKIVSAIRALSASPSPIPDPGVATTWKAVRDAIEICAGQMPGEYSFYTPAKACKAALEWTKFLEFAGAAAPKVLPGDDAMRLTWGHTSLPKFYLTITEEGEASVHEVRVSIKGGK